MRERWSRLLGKASSQRAARASIGLFIFCLIIQGAYVSVTGVTHADDTQDYLRTCDGWAEDPLRTATSWRGSFYATFTLVLCGWYALPVGGPTSWTALQVMFSALTTVVLHRLLLRWTTDAFALLGSVALALLWEVFRWTTYVLSDTLFVLLITLAAWTVLSWRERPTTVRRNWAIAVLALLAFSRPAGLPAALGWLLTPSSTGRRLFPLAVVAALALPALSLLVVAGSTFGVPHESNQEVWKITVADNPFLDNPLPFREVENQLLFVVVNAPQVGLTMVVRLGAILFPFSPTFSFAHNVLNGVMLVPLVFLAIAGVLTTSNRSPIWWLTLPPLLGNGFIVAVSFVDFDWRFRAPFIPFLLLFATIGLRALWQILRENRVSALAGDPVASRGTNPATPPFAFHADQPTEKRDNDAGKVPPE